MGVVADMDWNIVAGGVLLVLAGLYFLETELTVAPAQDADVERLKPARNSLERAWLAEPIQVFMRQLLAVRHRRSAHWSVQIDQQ